MMNESYLTFQVLAKNGLLSGPRDLFAIAISIFSLAGLFLQPSLCAEHQNKAVGQTYNLIAQESPPHYGPRSIRIEIFYPHGDRANINAETGVILTLHNWGGTGAMGTADPVVLADRYNLIAITVDYLQSGQADNSKEPYDFGYLQALDALRALRFVLYALAAAKIEFNRERIFATGGSGGGNVALMCNKLAPRTFACIIDLSGMAKLTDDIAFNLPGGATLNAGYSQNPQSPKHLSVDAQQLRFIGDPSHLRVMRRLGNSCKVVVVHGVEDQSCPIGDARELVKNMQSAGLDVEAHWIDSASVDGKIFRNAGHSLGDRTEIVKRVADEYLLPSGPKSLRRYGKTDFELRDDRVRYRTSTGQFVISYADGVPSGRFQPNSQ